MAWLLVYLTVTSTGTQIEEIDLYPTMIECFQAKELLAYKTNSSLYFPVNTQAVCIRTEHM
jgi:hypothetical protein